MALAEIIQQLESTRRAIVAPYYVPGLWTVSYTHLTLPTIYSV